MAARSVSPLLSSFNAGELTPLLASRSDIKQYPHGCRTLINWIPLVHGGVTKRPGMRYGSATKFQDRYAILLPFEFSTVQAYQLEFGHQYMRIHRDDAPISLPPVAITAIAIAAGLITVTAPGHTFVAGNRILISFVGGMTQVNNREFQVTNPVGNNFDLLGIDGTTYDAYIAGGQAVKFVEIVTPYTEAQLDQISYAQSADVLYLAHPHVPRQKLTRTSHTDWTITPIADDWPAFQDENKIETLNVTASAAVGVGITITASAALFTAADVGRIFKIAVVPETEYKLWVALDPSPGAGTFVRFEGNVYEQIGIGGAYGTIPPIHRVVGQQKSDGAVTLEYVHSGVGSVLITGFTNATTVIATVINEIPNKAVGGGANVTLKWSFGAFDEVNGYPCCVTFYEDRLWWAATRAQPQTFWASRTGDFENHEHTDDDESAFEATANSDEVNAIHWLHAKRNLLMGTSSSEWAVSASIASEAINRANRRALEHSTEGSRANVKPISINKEIFFVQRAGRKLLSMSFDFDSDQYIASDRTILAEHIAIGRFKLLAHQQEPLRLIWAELEDGALVALTYLSEDVVAWHRHAFGGSGVAVESGCVTPRSNGEGDKYSAIVRRTVDGQTVRYVEHMSQEWLRGDDIEDAVFVDSSIEYDGAPTTTITGLWHLNGQTVQVLGDGLVRTPVVVAGGKIVLATPASKAQIGLHYFPRLETMRLERNAQGHFARVESIVLSLDQAGAGLFYGPSFDELSELSLRDPGDSMSDPVPLRDRLTERLSWEGGYLRGNHLCIEHRLPLPCTVLALQADMSVENR